MKPLFVIAQPYLPHHLISRVVGLSARSKFGPLKNSLIRFVSKSYGITLEDYVIEDASQYESFNAFFTRAVKPQARPIDTQKNAIASPVDGCVSQLGVIDGQQIFQAKGKQYTSAALLGSSEWAKEFDNGRFATLYLAPNNYHRIHMPCDGTLTSLRYVPGRLFSVNTQSATYIDQVFARNERVVARFDTDFGPMAMIMVGALNVGSIETVEQGVIAPNSQRVVTDIKLAQYTSFAKGQEYARFNLGSTVILLFGNQGVDWHDQLGAGSEILMGKAIGARLG